MTYQPLLRDREVSHSYGELAVLRDIDLDIADGGGWAWSARPDRAGPPCCAG